MRYGARMRRTIEENFVWLGRLMSGSYIELREDMPFR